MKRVHRLAVMILAAALMLLNTEPVKGQAGIGMDLSASYQFGEQITFMARLIDPLQIQKASILIHDTSQVITHIEPVTFNAQGVSEYRFDTRRNIVRPFTTLLWRYDLTLTDGSVVQSATGSIRYDDDRFVWQSLAADALNIHWYDGDEQFGLAALNAAQSGLQNVRGIFAPNLSEPLDVFIYSNEKDLRGTLYGAESWVAGHADSAAGVIMVMVESGATQNIIMEQRIPHELMHVLLYRQVGAGYMNIPAWLREGMSMLVEVYPNPDYDRVLKDAAARGALTNIHELCDSFSLQVDSAFLAYAESRSFTNYLRGRYGADGLLSLANTYADGVDCERGPERAFGVTLVQLERDWRVSVLGQNSILASATALAPYLALLCLVLLFPMIGVVGTMRKKGTPHGR